MFSLTNSIHHPFEVRFSQEWKFERVKPWTSAALRFLSQKKALQQWDIRNSCYHAYGRNIWGKNASATGQGFYLERNALHNILADAKLWSQTALRVPRTALLGETRGEYRYTVFGFTERTSAAFTAEVFVCFSIFFLQSESWGLHDYWTAWCWEIRVHHLDSRTLSKICARVFSSLWALAMCLHTLRDTLQKLVKMTPKISKWKV